MSSSGQKFLRILIAFALIGLGLGAYYFFTHKKINYLVDVDSAQPLGVYTKFAISTDASECAPLAKAILLKNGTAVDAAITTLLCMAVVLPHGLGLGGGCFMNYYDRKSKKSIIYDGREQAPAHVRDTNFTKDNLLNGPLSVAIPGELQAYHMAHREYGKLSWAELFEGPIELARRGVRVNRHLAKNIKKNKNRFYEPLKKLLMKENSTTEFLEEGDILKRPDLADTYEMIANAKDPIELFYRGKLTDIFVDELAEAGVTREDFANYQVNRSEGIVVDLDDENRMFVSTLPSSGVLLGFIMKVVATLKDELIKPGMEYSLDDTANFYHKLTEILKHAYSRRAAVADENFEPAISEELLRNFTIFNETNKYFEDVVNKVRESRITHDPPFYGGLEYFVPDNGTSHMSIIDQYGNAISVTSTINIYFGSGMLSKTGIIFNDENDDFSVANLINYFGLPSAKANLIEPGKRPASSMCPTIVTNRKTDEAKLSIGASGGSLIISGLAQAITRILYMNQNIKVAIDQWRYHHQLYPNEFQYEEKFNHKILAQMKNKYNHTIIPIPNRHSVLSAVSKDATGRLYANTDFRKGGSVDGV